MDGHAFDELVYLRAEVERLREQVLVERPLPVVKGLRAPFPWFGSKRIAAPLIWGALGNPGNLVIPFAGSLAELWARPEPGKVETVNDADGLLCNVWRSIQRDPDAVAEHADHPVIELDQHAWHRTLVEAANDVKARLQTDPRWYDAELAGRWVWGASAWLGSGWCDGSTSSLQPKRPHLAGSDGSGVGYGSGIHNGEGRRIEGLTVWMRQLSDRLRLVRVTCGDFERAVTPAVTVSHGPTGIIWDPPYTPDERCPRIYAQEDAKGTPRELTTAQRAAARARELDAEFGRIVRPSGEPLLRQVFCGYEGEHDFPGWACVPWRARGGYGLQAHGRGRENRERERLWLSPRCLHTSAPKQMGFDLSGGTG